MNEAIATREMKQEEVKVVAPGTSRITSVDGLRAVAVLGVVWAHLWAFGFSSAPLFCGPVDCHRILSICGTGVDLFFVISGFCMYLVYLNKTEVSITSFVRFVFRRFVRIGPAYYVSALFCAIVLGVWDIYSLIAHALFLHTILPNVNELAAPFWSIATEMHFYLVLPVFAFMGRGRRMVLTTIALLVVSIIFGVWLSIQAQEVRHFWHNQLPTRLCEFCWGILVGLAYSRTQWRSNNFAVLAASIAVICLGRSLMTNRFVEGSWDMQIIGAFGVPILSGGFAVLTWCVLQEKCVLHPILRSRIFQIVGKYSYSLYLWHWIPCGFVAAYWIKHFGNSGISLDLCFVVLTALLLVVSKVSYQRFEQPYFRYKAIIAKS